ncbi:ribonuclease Z [Mangrovivirga sp. M17]|uniref:Ribonuclease Z n=1 Tax=Mangrovivirga halotolerans TaxID=2993936 RepID=A0ABT3RWP5_9BACT|nr:ribonuclease Z [Mangrovivirga halotolerans]MCX2746073.1 ribonuclease Z [Mangrovivirga halotolerans]
MAFYITILGSNASTPAYGRNQTSQYIKLHGHNFLMDCGEGTQLLLKKNRLKIQRINKIFISHLHGDHYFGLIGLVSTMHLLGRTTPLEIYGPKGLGEILTIQFKYSDTKLRYELTFHELDYGKSGVIFEDKKIQVEHFPLKHRIDCHGYIFREKPKPIRINREAIPQNLGVEEVSILRQGKSVYNEDGSIKYDKKEYTLPPRKSFSYAFASDTIYDPEIVDYIKDVDLLYHESTFLKDEEERAAQTFHCTTLQAADIAKRANVGKLLLGHYSTRYRNLAPFADEAKEIFENSELSVEGKVYELKD